MKRLIMTIAAIAAWAAGNLLHAQALPEGFLPELPMQTYIPYRMQYPYYSPFYINGKWPNNSINMIIKDAYGFKQRDIAGWTLIRGRSTMTYEIEVFDAQGISAAYNKYVHTYDPFLGFKVDMTYGRNGTTATTGWAWDFKFDATTWGNSWEYQKRDAGGGQHTEEHKYTSSRWGVIPAPGTSLPTEIAVRWHGAFWPYQQWFGDFNTIVGTYIDGETYLIAPQGGYIVPTHQPPNYDVRYIDFTSQTLILN